MVKFHKGKTCFWFFNVESYFCFYLGSIPEGIPQDILPADYGGEAPSVEELDRETKSMVDKYAGWLKESVHFKADENKRVKKASWWGLFSGSNSTERIDEKAILKNLQIDWLLLLFR